MFFFYADCLGGGLTPKGIHSDKSTPYGTLIYSAVGWRTCAHLFNDALDTYDINMLI